MTDTPEVVREHAEHHAKEAERLLKSWWLSTHVKAQVHATLAAYYMSSAERSSANGRSGTGSVSRPSCENAGSTP